MTKPNRRAVDRLTDIQDAINAINRYVGRDGGLADEVTFDAVRMRFIEIGEAANNLRTLGLTKAEPDIAWDSIVGMRNRLAHGYHDTQQRIVEDAIANDLPALATAVERLRARACAKTIEDIDSG